MAKKPVFKVKDVALLTGVSVRTLHYYDEIGLLVPGDRSAAGYRLYDENDLLRLQQILIGRTLGFALEEIRRSLDEPGFDYASSLREQRGRLIVRLNETHKMIAAIDSTLTSLGDPEAPIDFRKVFDGFDPREHEAETRSRWSGSDAYAESARRTKTYTEKEWTLIKAELDTIWSDAAKAMRQNAAPDSYVALEIVERHRQHVCRWFYELSPEMHMSLSELWTSDERFRKNIDKYGEGLTAWLAGAVRAAGEAI